jgi:hypothetical protein
VQQKEIPLQLAQRIFYEENAGTLPDFEEFFENR